MDSKPEEGDRRTSGKLGDDEVSDLYNVLTINLEEVVALFQAAEEGIKMAEENVLLSKQEVEVAERNLRIAKETWEKANKELRSSESAYEWFVNEYNDGNQEEK